jgi:hypothetical protein
VAGRKFATQVVFNDGWHARHGWVRAFDESGQPIEYRPFEETVLDLESPDYFITEQPDADPHQ